MKLRKPLPSDRSFEQIYNHYLVEKSIAEKLKASNREERKRIYKTMYDELYSKVPDHPRLHRRESTLLTEDKNRNKLSLVHGLLNRSKVFVEFAAGDCRFAAELAKYVKYVYGIDISDQRNPAHRFPKNFSLIVYDGYELNEIESESVDVVFSDQLIEHFHPEDTKLHFKLVHRLLKPGGKYVFRTPHSLSGPHDISQYFSDEEECFHLKEWTYIEIQTILMDLKYSQFCTRWCAKGVDIRMPYIFFAMCERILGLIPKKQVRIVAKCLMPSLYGIAVK